jgi:hypothetical protein
METIISTAMSLIPNTYSSVRGVREDVKNLSSKLSVTKAVLADAENMQVNNQ